MGKLKLKADLVRENKLMTESNAMTDHYEIKPFKDLGGKWIILFSYAVDIENVNAKAFSTYTTMQKEFSELHNQLTKMSNDGLYSHIAWLFTSEEIIRLKRIKNAKYKFHLTENIAKPVNEIQSVLQPCKSIAHAAQAVIYIDPHGNRKALIYYPMVFGKNFEEIKRVIFALRTADFRNQ